MDRTLTAKQFLARDYAGLILAGISMDGYQWMGDKEQWEAAEINDADSEFPSNEYGSEMRWLKHQ